MGNQVCLTRFGEYLVLFCVFFDQKSIQTVRFFRISSTGLHAYFIEVGINRWL